MGKREICACAEASHGGGLSLALSTRSAARTRALAEASSTLPSGRVAITWAVEKSRLIINWLERDGPTIGKPSRKGFGTELIERELKGSSEVRIARSQESGGGATTGPSAETPAPRKIPTRDEDGGGRMTSTKPSGPNAPAGPSAETSALKKVPTHDEGSGSRMNSTKPSGPNAAAGPSAETPALKKVPTRDEGSGSRMNSTKPSGAKRPRRKGPGEGSPN